MKNIYSINKTDLRKRNKCGLFLSLCMAVAWTTQAQTSADGYVIALEGDDVYIDLAEGKIAKGDILEVKTRLFRASGYQETDKERE